MSVRVFTLWAACRHNDPADYFPPDPRGPARDQATAKVIRQCQAHCPVRALCAGDALSRGAFHGVVAGLDLGPPHAPVADAAARLRRIAGTLAA